MGLRMDNLFRSCLPSSACNWCNCSKPFTQKSHSKQRQGPNDRLPDSTRSPACPVAPPTSGPLLPRGAWGRTTNNLSPLDNTTPPSPALAVRAGKLTDQTEQTTKKTEQRKKGPARFSPMPNYNPPLPPNHIDQAKLRPRQLNHLLPKQAPSPDPDRVTITSGKAGMKQTQSQDQTQAKPPKTGAASGADRPMSCHETKLSRRPLGPVRARRIPPAGNG